MRRRLLTLVLGLCLGADAWAEPGLAELYRLAEQNDTVYAAARATFEADREYGAIGLSGLLPSLSLGLDASRTSIDRNSSLAGGSGKFDYDSRSAALSLSQSLFNLEKFKAYAEGNARVAYAAAVLAEERQNLALRMSQAYFDVLVAQNNLDLAIAQRNAEQAQAEQARHLFDAGVATVTDMEESRARYQVSAAQVLLAGNVLEVSRQTLGKIVHEVPRELGSRGPYTFTPVLPEPNDMDSWKQAARAQNLRVLSQQASVGIARLQADKAYAQHYPSLELTAQLRKDREPALFVDDETASKIGLQLSVPLYEGGRISAESRRSVQLVEKARSDLETSQRDSEIAVTEAFLGVASGIAQIAALEQAVKSNEITLKGMEIGQRNGFRTNTDVLDAQQQLYAVKRDLQRERYQYLLNWLKLKAAVGSLGWADLQAVDAMVAIGN